MALVSISTVTPRAASYVRKCPNPVIERALMDEVIYLCEKGNVWRVAPSDIATVSGDYDYAISGLPAGTEVANVLSSTLDEQAIDVATVEYIKAKYPTWPNTDLDQLSQPRILTFMQPQTLLTAPVPDTAYTIKLLVSVRPQPTSTQVEESILNEHLNAVVFSAVHRLLMQREAPWADLRAGEYYGRMGRYYATLGAAKANKSHTRADLFVVNRPFA